MPSSVLPITSDVHTSSDTLNSSIISLQIHVFKDTHSPSLRAFVAYSHGARIHARSGSLHRAEVFDAEIRGVAEEHAWAAANAEALTEKFESTLRYMDWIGLDWIGLVYSGYDVFCGDIRAVLCTLPRLSSVITLPYFSA